MRHWFVAPLLDSSGATVQACNGGVLFGTENADSWTRTPSDASLVWCTLPRSGTKVVACGGGVLLGIENADSWTRTPWGTSLIWCTPTRSGAKVGACDGGGVLLAIENADSWTRNPGITDEFESIAVVGLALFGSFIERAASRWLCICVESSAGEMRERPFFDLT